MIRTLRKKSKAIREDKVNLQIHEGRQGKYIRNHANYTEGRSYLTISMKKAQELVKKYAGTGVLQYSKSTGKWLKREYVTSDAIVGFDIHDVTGKKTKTNSFKIHYSKYGVHIVPKLR